ASWGEGSQRGLVTAAPKSPIGTVSVSCSPPRAARSPTDPISNSPHTLHLKRPHRLPARPLPCYDSPDVLLDSRGRAVQRADKPPRLTPPHIRVEVHRRRVLRRHEEADEMPPPSGMPGAEAANEEDVELLGEPSGASHDVP